MSSAEVIKVSETTKRHKIWRQNTGDGRTSEMRPCAVREQRGRDRREALFLSQRSSCFPALRRLGSKSERKKTRSTENLREAV